MSTDNAMSESEAAGLFSIPNDTGTPERRLLLAILERAILDYVGNDQREQEAADEWLFDFSGESSFELSFSDICEALDLDEKLVRAKIEKMPKRGSNKVAPWYFSRKSG